MRSYTIEFAPRTEGQLAIIPKSIRKQIFDKIEKLAKNPLIKEMMKLPISY